MVFPCVLPLHDDREPPLDEPTHFRVWMEASSCSRRQLTARCCLVRALRNDWKKGLQVQQDFERYSKPRSTCEVRAWRSPPLSPCPSSLSHRPTALAGAPVFPPTIASRISLGLVAPLSSGAHSACARRCFSSSGVQVCGQLLRNLQQVAFRQMSDCRHKRCLAAALAMDRALRSGAACTDCGVWAAEWCWWVCVCGMGARVRSWMGWTVRGDAIVSGPVV
jgi:hypothetical protein